MKDFRNDLLHRKEVKVIVEAENNPGFANAAKMIADKYKSSDENVSVKSVNSKFGRNTFLIDAYIYDSAQDRERIEPKKKVKESKK